MHQDTFHSFADVLGGRPHAWAEIRGSGKYPNLRGIVRFFRTNFGTLVETDVRGLPDPGKTCSNPVFGFHIHDGGSCTGNETDPFADAGMHYNPENCPHPAHAGDLPPLFGNAGYAYSVFLTSRFRINEIIGRTVIIHRSPDDFTTQPAGNSGEKIACGVIVPAPMPY